MLENIGRLFSGATSAIKRTKVTKIVREFGSDGKVTKETIETTEDGRAADDISKEMGEQFGDADEFFRDLDDASRKFSDTMNTAFSRFFKKKE